MTDGNITLSVTLSPLNIQNTAKKLRGEIENIFKNLGEDDVSPKLGSILAQMDKLLNKSEEIQTEMDSIKTKNLSEIEKGWREAKDSLFKYSDLLDQIQEKPLGTTKAGEKFGKMADGSLITEGKVKAEIDQIIKDMQILEQEWDIVNAGSVDDEKYIALSQRLNEVNNQLVIQKAKYDALQNASEVIDEVGTAAEETAQKTTKLGQVLGKVGEVAKKGFAGVGAVISKVGSPIRAVTSAVGGRLSKAFSGVKKVAQKAFSFKGLTQGFKRLLQYTFGVYSLIAVFNKLKSAAEEGMKNLVQYKSKSNETNKAMTEFNTSLLYIKNAWAAAFAPVVNYVMPVLTRLMDLVAQVGNTIARFVGVLTGAKQVLQAVRVSAGDYAKSLDKSSKSTKKLHDRLASFDDLNVLGKDDDSGSGSGATDTPDPNDMFTKVDVDSSEFADILGFIDKIKQKIIDSGLIDAFNNLKDAFMNFKDSSFVKTLEDIAMILANDTFTSVLGVFTDALNLLANVLNGDLLGSLGSLRDVLADLTFDPLITFADIIDRLLGTNIGGWLRDVKQSIKDIDISQLPGYEKLKEAFDKLKESGEKLKTAIQNFWKMLEETGVLDAIKDFITWLAEQSINVTLEGIATALDLISGAMDLIADILNGDFLGAIDDLKNILATLTFQPLETILGIIDSIIGTDMAGWLKGVEDAVKNFDLGQWLSELPGKFSGFFDDVKKGFEMFKQDPFGTIKKGWDTLVGNIKTIDINPFNKIKEGWDAITQKIQSIDWTKLGQQIGTNVGTAIKNLKDKFVEFFTVTLPGFINDIKTFFGETVPNFIKTEVPKWWETIKTGAKTFFTVTLPTFFTQDVPNAFKSVGTSIWEGIKAGWNTLLAAGKGVKDFIDGFIKGFKDALGIHSPSTVFEGFGKNIVEGLKNGLKGLWESIKSIFVGENGIVGKIKKNMNFDGLKKSIETAWGKIKDIFVGEKSIITKIKNVFSGKGSLADKIKSAFPDVGATVKRIWGDDKSGIVGTFVKVKEKILGFVKDIKSNMGGMWTYIQNKIKTPINAIIGFFNKFIEGVVKAINTIIETLNKFQVKIPDGIPGLGGKTIGFNLGKLTPVKIPTLAEGAVIPPNKEFLAMLGDQAHGTNIEAPLDTIKQAVAEELAEQIGVLEDGFNAVVNAINRKELVVGDKDIGKANARYTANQRIIKGTAF